MGRYDEDYEPDEHAAERHADRICDSDCMGANGCGGHGTCAHCGDVVCGCELDEHDLCGSCSENRSTCELCGEELWIGEDDCISDENGHFCSEECRKAFYAEADS